MHTAPGGSGTSAPARQRPIAPLRPGALPVINTMLVPPKASSSLLDSSPPQLHPSEPLSASGTASVPNILPIPSETLSVTPKSSQIDTSARIGPSHLQNAIHTVPNVAPFASVLQHRDPSNTSLLDGTTGPVLGKDSLQPNMFGKSANGTSMGRQQRDDLVAKQFLFNQRHSQNADDLQKHGLTRRQASSSNLSSAQMNNSSKTYGSSGLSQFQQGFNFAQQGALTAAAAANPALSTPGRNKKALDKVKINGSPPTSHKWGSGFAGTHTSPRTAGINKKPSGDSLRIFSNDVSSSAPLSASPSYQENIQVSAAASTTMAPANSTVLLPNFECATNNAATTDKLRQDPNIGSNSGEKLKSNSGEGSGNVSLVMGTTGILPPNPSSIPPELAAGAGPNGTVLSNIGPTTSGGSVSSMAEKHRIERARRDMEVYKQKKARLEKAPNIDFERVLKVDFETPFKTPIDAWQRLMPYHVLMDPDGEHDLSTSWEQHTSKISEQYRLTFDSLKKKCERIIDRSFEDVISSELKTSKNSSSEGDVGHGGDMADNSRDKDSKCKIEDEWVLTSEEAFDVEKVLLEDCVLSIRREAEVARLKAAEEAAKLAAQEAEQRRIQEAMRANAVRLYETQNASGSEGIRSEANKNGLGGGMLGMAYCADPSLEVQSRPSGLYTPSVGCSMQLARPPGGIPGGDGSNVTGGFSSPGLANANSHSMSNNPIGNTMARLHADLREEHSGTPFQNYARHPQTSPMHPGNSLGQNVQQSGTQLTGNQYHPHSQQLHQHSQHQFSMLMPPRQQSSPLDMMQGHPQELSHTQHMQPPTVGHQQMSISTYGQGDPSLGVPSTGQHPGTLNARAVTTSNQLSTPPANQAQSLPPSATGRDRGHLVTQGSFQRNPMSAGCPNEPRSIPFMNSNGDGQAMFGNVGHMTDGRVDDWNLARLGPGGEGPNSWDVSGRLENDDLAQKLNRAPPPCEEGGRVGMGDLLNGDNHQ